MVHPQLALSPGWNMINTTSSNFISQAQVDQIRPLLPTFHGGSYSWNTHAGCSNTITFVGTSITAYGLAGPDSGEYSVVLDGDQRMLSAKSDAVDYGHVLFTVAGLNEETHTLTFTNLVEGNWFGFDYAAISTDTSVHSAASSPSSPAKDFHLPEGLLVPAHMLLAGQPSPEQLSLIMPYHAHWTPGAYFVVFVAGVSLASLYVFFLFQFAGMLRDKAGEDICPVADKRKQLPRFAQQEPGYSKRFSWAAGLEGMNEEGDGDDEMDKDRQQMNGKVKNALKMKQISGPSPIPEAREQEEGMRVKEFKPLDRNTASPEASGSGTGSCNRGEEESDAERTNNPGKRNSIQSNKRNSTQSQDGTWPRRPGSFPRLSFSASSPSSPRSPRVTPGFPMPGTPGGRSMKGYF